MPGSRKITAAIRIMVAAGVVFGISQVPAAVADTETDGAGAVAKDGCVSREKFREDAYITRRIDRNIPGNSSGDVALATDRLFDEKGKRIGTTDSKATMYISGDPTSNPAGADLMQMFEATDYFRDGSVYLAGIASISEVLSGKPATLSATGLSGVYRNKIGVRTFRLVAVNPDHIIYESSLKVCTPPPFPAPTTEK